jgi:hypothetical protein
MRGLDDPSLANLRDPRTKLIIDMLSGSVWETGRIAAFLQAAGLSPADYSFETAKLAWIAAVPDAAKKGRLSELLARVIEEAPAFGGKLEDSLERLRSGRDWYYNDDPYTSGFVGLHAGHAVIDRAGLRNGLRDLATDNYRILVVSGKAGSGKTHSWLLLAHLRDAGRLTGEHRFVLVTAHDWEGREVTGEDLVRALVDKLGLNIDLAPSAELDDARSRKFLDKLVGNYPSRDGITWWIMLDGLDLPGVQKSARDVAKRLITMIGRYELRDTRLIVTGLDDAGVTIGDAVPVEEIPAMDKNLVRTFLEEVAGHLGHAVTSEELDAGVAEVLGQGEPPRSLKDVEKAVVALVQTHWADGGQHDK